MPTFRTRSKKSLTPTAPQKIKKWMAVQENKWIIHKNIYRNTWWNKWATLHVLSYSLHLYVFGFVLLFADFFSIFYFIWCIFHDERGFLLTNPFMNVFVVFPLLLPLFPEASWSFQPLTFKYRRGRGRGAYFLFSVFWKSGLMFSFTRIRKKR